MSDSFAKQKFLEDSFAGDVTPTMSTIDILSSLKLLNQTKELIGNDEDAPLAKIASEEIKYLDAAMKALTDNPLFQDKFGSGFNGAMQLSGLLKAHHSKMVYDHIMNGVIGSSDKFDIAEFANKRNRGKAWE